MSQKKAQLLNPLNGNLNVTGVITASSFVGGLTGNVTGDVTGTASTATLANTATVATNAQGLTGTPNITVGSVTAASGSFSGNVSVGGTLSYQDVTNIDSIGIITAQQGIQVLANGLDITGVGTFKSDVSIADKIIHTGDTDTAIRFPAADTFTVETSGSEALRVDSSGRLGIGTNNPGANLHVQGATGGAGQIYVTDGDADGIGNSFLISKGGTTTTLKDRQASSNLDFGTADTIAMRIDSSQRVIIGSTSARVVGTNRQFTIEGTDSPTSSASIFRNSNNAGGAVLALGKSRGTSDGSSTVLQSGDQAGAIFFNGADGTDAVSQVASISAEIDGTPGSNDMPGRLVFNTTSDGADTVTERLRITSRGGFHFSNGFMNETVKINTTARTGTQAVNLDDGMVHYFSTNSAGTWKPNFTMSAGDDINATIAIGDVFSPTMIVAKGADTHFANSAEVDGTTIGSIEFAGGAPTDGGASGTFDVYNYSIIKIGDDSFKAFVSVSNYE